MYRKSSSKATIIASIIGAIATITAAFIGNSYGEKNTVQKLYSQATTVNGNNNTVTVNSVDDFVAQYNKLLNENETLKAQNSQYFTDYTEQKNINSVLESQLEERPNVLYKNVGLTINGDDIPINKNNSVIIIDGREYYSKEIAENLISDDFNSTIKDDTLFVGKIIADKESLLNKNIVDSNFVKMGNYTDSYGNTHVDSLCFWSHECHIIYNLENKYAFFKCNLSIRDDANMDIEGTLIIKADDNIVYTSPKLTKMTNPFDIVDIPINNCTLLTIEFDKPIRYQSDCIVSDAIVYN